MSTLPMLARLTDKMMSVGSIRRAPSVVIPTQWGTVGRPDVLVAVFSAAFKIAREHGVPSAQTQIGKTLVRRVLPGVRHSFLMQSQTPPLDVQPSNRMSSIPADFIQFAAGITARQSGTQRDSARYFGVGFLPVFSEQMKYDLPKLFRQFPQLIDEHQVGGNVVAHVARDASFFRFQIQSDLRAVDLRSTSPVAKDFLAEVGRNEVVEYAMRTTRNGTVMEGVYDLNDHSVAQAVAAAVRMANPDIDAILFSSAPALHQGSSRDNLAIFGHPQTQILQITPLDIVTIKNDGGTFSVEARPTNLTLEEMQKMKAQVIEL